MEDNICNYCDKPIKLESETLIVDNLFYHKSCKSKFDKDMVIDFENGDNYNARYDIVKLRNLNSLNTIPYTPKIYKSFIEKIKQQNTYEKKVNVISFNVELCIGISVGVVYFYNEDYNDLVARYEAFKFIKHSFRNKFKLMITTLFKYYILRNKDVRDLINNKIEEIIWVNLPKKLVEDLLKCEN